MAEESDRGGGEAITAPTPEALLACAYEVLSMAAQDCVRGLKAAVAEAKGDPLVVLGRTVRVIGSLARSVLAVVELSLGPPKRRGRRDPMSDEGETTDGRGHGAGGDADQADRIARLRAQIERDFQALRGVYELKRMDAGLERSGASPSYGRQLDGPA